MEAALGLALVLVEEDGFLFHEEVGGGLNPVFEFDAGKEGRNLV